jgi:hypothetical protein
MEKVSILKSIVDFQKDVFFRWYDAMSILQAQLFLAMDMMLNQTSWISDEERQRISNWASTCKNERDWFKIHLEENFCSLEGHLHEMPPMERVRPIPPCPPKKEGSYGVPQAYLADNSIKAHSKACLRLPALWLIERGKKPGKIAG